VFQALLLDGDGRWTFGTRALTGFAPPPGRLGWADGMTHGRGGNRRPTTGIALDLGFDSPSHFAAASRRCFGEPPSQTRQAN